MNQSLVGANMMKALCDNRSAAKNAKLQESTIQVQQIFIPVRSAQR